MTTGTNHNCHWVRRPDDLGLDPLRRVRARAAHRRKAEVAERARDAAILRATPLSRGKDEETLPMFDEAVGARPHQEPDDKKRRPRRRKGSV